MFHTPLNLVVMNSINHPLSSRVITTSNSQVTVGSSSKVAQVSHPVKEEVSLKTSLDIIKVNMMKM